MYKMSASVLGAPSLHPSGMPCNDTESDVRKDVQSVSLTEGVCADDSHTPDIPSGPLTLDTLLEEVSKQLRACEHLPLSARQKIKQLLSQYDVSLGELDRYMLYDPAKKYTRNLIASDDKFTLMLLCWNQEKESPIHDHPCHGCWMRVVCGTVEEYRYRIDTASNKLEQTSMSVGHAGDCIYIDDNIGLHKVRNPSATAVACSLHLYSPPYDRCSIWLDDNVPADKPLHPTVTYFSEYGTVVTYEDCALTS